MSYKTIFIHVTDERRVHGLVEAVLGIADAFESHVIGLYALPGAVIGPPFAGNYGAGLAEAGRRAFRKEADGIKRIFDETFTGHATVREWRCVEPERESLPGLVLRHARAADLVVVSQRDHGFAYHQLLDMPERLAIESGRPTIIVPNAGRFPELGRRVTVAWNGRREAARAVFDALPLLVRAEQVQLLWVNPEPGASGDLPTAEIGATLARHGVKCDADQSVAADLAIGDELLSRLADNGSDLLVMGAYGHSRLREFVFGGATRHILEHMTVPVLMSH
jgi:nucleotide-binding universal stress UspA family protein